MIESIDLNVSENWIDSILNTQGNRNESLFSELMHHTTSIESMLGNYYFENRGNVYGLVIDKDSFVFKDHLSGHLKLNYSISYFLGCQDLTYDDKGVMRIDFEIDAQNKIIKLTGEEIRERDPDLY